MGDVVDLPITDMTAATVLMAVRPTSVIVGASVTFTQLSLKYMTDRFLELDTARDGKQIPVEWHIYPDAQCRLVQASKSATLTRLIGSIRRGSHLEVIAGAHNDFDSVNYAHPALLHVGVEQVKWTFNVRGFHLETAPLARAFLLTLVNCLK